MSLRQADQGHSVAVQRQLLPPQLGDVKGYTVGALSTPAFAVGGDFYDHYWAEGGRGLIVTVADVMGKGLIAASIAANVRSALRTVSLVVDTIDYDPAVAVKRMADQLIDDLAENDSFLTLFHARLDVDSGAVDYVDAGHGLAVKLHADGRAEPLKGDGLPVGVLPDECWASQRVALSPGDTLAVVSDGALDLVGGEDHVREALQFLRRHPSPHELCASVEALVGDQPLLDDITLVVIRRDRT